MFTLLSVVILYGCVNNNSQYTKFHQKPESTENIKRLDMAHDPNTISYGIIGSNGYAENNEVYYLDENEQFSRFINIENYIGFDCGFTLLTFINYVQSDFLVENKNNISHEVFIQNEKDLSVPVTINNLNIGYNDIIFLIIPSANTSERSPEERFKAFQPVYLRCTAMVGKPSPVKSPEPLEIISLKGENKEIYINDDNSGNQESQTVEFNQKQNISLYITFDNTDSNTEDEDCVIILLKNLVQEELLGKKFLYTQIPDDKKITIQYDQPNSETGYYEYLAIQINRPYRVINSYGEVEDVEFSAFTGVKVSE